jgi:phage baseplate assembly protein W
MPVRPIYRINPQVARPQRALGISVLYNGNGVFNQTITTKDQVKSQLINYVLTNKGERLFDPNFGGDIRRMLFDPTTNVDSIIATLEQGILEYVPGVIINNITINTDPDSYTANLIIDYSIYDQKDLLNINITQ